MSEYLPGVIWLVVLLAGNAFFVGAEFAVISARRSQIEPKAEAGSKAAKTTLWAMEHATLMLATSQLGITVCSLLILNVSEPAIHHLLEIPLGVTSLSAEAIGVIAFIVALALVTFLHVVFGEMVPKNLSFSVPDRAALILAPPLVMVSRFFKPVIWSLNGVANAVLRLFKVEPKDEASSTFTLDEVANIVEQSTREGVLDDTSGTLTAAFEFSAKKVCDVEVPMADMVVLPFGATPADVQHAVAEHGFSRYVVAGADQAPVGYLHLKDVMDLTEGDAFTAPVPAKRIRRLTSTFREADLEDALHLMRRTGGHVARSLDQDGVTTGVLFLEDIIEELVGEVQDAASM
ncbi:hemolysin family protein [Aeromicrobium wangtongii]|uniref:Hemolysin family protein n=1 Tax=Aeromicrobium wangtongii TaxID=2969247 RepID=A0ABY5M4H7_9ACTN|nr:hemolysin family protein [Aeromicrobium wangtongii]MCD9198346.1 hemolysin family protein [Aeromicrobium wangtongii]MCL3818965.1 hemolysin family protein [Aeromicrobium wangtongii]UUP12377.1 hemolysin family protein [Aeromicrobium wangtongii]